MVLKVEITEDTLTEYMDQVYDLANDQSNERRFIRDAGLEIHEEFIFPRMPKWNPNLILSPLEPQNQLIEITEDKSVIELLYTGFTEQALAKELEKGVWSEFGDKVEGKLERDYAEYQETGIDVHARNDDERAPRFRGHHYVEFGLKASVTHYNNKVLYYLDRLMHLQKWEGVQKISIFDYLE